VPNFALTDIAIRRLPAPARGTTTYWDTNTKGLGLRVSQGGAKTFIVLVGSGQRHKIGRYPLVSLQAARLQAKKTLGEIALGRFLPKSISFDEAKRLFLANVESRARASTHAEYRRLLTKHFPFERKQVGSISTTDIAKKIDRLNDTPSEARHALVVIKMLFRWLLRRGHIQNDPCATLEMPKTRGGRERALTDSEIKEILLNASRVGFPFGLIVMLLVLTGQRRGEIAALRWTYIDMVDRTITLPATLTKNRRQHTFPFSQGVADLLKAIPEQSEYLFPASREHVHDRPTSTFNGWPKAKRRFDAMLEGVGPWTLHDLRRTFSTGMASLAVPQVVVEKLLNHVSGGALSPIAQVYNRHSYMSEMRAAVAAWDGKLASLVRS